MFSAQRVPNMAHNKSRHLPGRDPFAVEPLPKTFYHPSRKKQLSAKTRKTALKTDWEEAPVPQPDPSDELFLKGTNCLSRKPPPRADGTSPPSPPSLDETWPSVERPSDVSANGSVTLVDVDSSAELGPLSELRQTLFSTLAAESSKTASNRDKTGEGGRDAPTNMATSTIQKYVERFRHGEPMSRDERAKLRKEVREEFWWLGSDAPAVHSSSTPESERCHPSIPESFKTGESKSYRKETEETVKYRPPTLIDLDPESKRLTDRADELLERSEGSLLSSGPVVSTMGLGSEESSTVTDVSYEEKPRRPILTHKPQDLLPLGGTTLMPGEDILYQWRLRRKLELARQGRAPTSLRRPLSQTEADSRLEEFRQKLSARSQGSSAYAEISARGRELLSALREEDDRRLPDSARAASETCAHVSSVHSHPHHAPFLLPPASHPDMVPPHYHLSCDIVDCAYCMALRTGSNLVPPSQPPNHFSRVHPHVPPLSSRSDPGALPPQGTEAAGTEPHHPSCMGHGSLPHPEGWGFDPRVGRGDFSQPGVGAVDHQLQQQVAGLAPGFPHSGSAGGGVQGGVVIDRRRDTHHHGDQAENGQAERGQGFVASRGYTSQPQFCPHPDTSTSKGSDHPHPEEDRMDAVLPSHQGKLKQTVHPQEDASGAPQDVGSLEHLRLESKGQGRRDVPSSAVDRRDSSGRGIHYKQFLQAEKPSSEDSPLQGGRTGEEQFAETYGDVAGRSDVESESDPGRRSSFSDSHRRSRERRERRDDHEEPRNGQSRETASSRRRDGEVFRPRDDDGEEVGSSGEFRVGEKQRTKNHHQKRSGKDWTQDRSVNNQSREGPHFEGDDASRFQDSTEASSRASDPKRVSRHRGERGGGDHSSRRVEASRQSPSRSASSGEEEVSRSRGKEDRVTSPASPRLPQPPHSSSPLRPVNPLRSAIGQVVSNHLFQSPGSSLVLSSVDSWASISTCAPPPPLTRPPDSPQRSASAQPPDQLPATAQGSSLPLPLSSSPVGGVSDAEMDEGPYLSDGAFEEDEILSILRKQRASHQELLREIDELICQQRETGRAVLPHE